MDFIRFTAFGVVLAVAGCSSLPASNPVQVVAEPEPTLPLLSDLDVAEEAPNVTLAAPPQREGGLFARLLGRGQPSEPSAVDAALAEALGETDVAASETETEIA